jgi:ABC-type transport system involved in multi-copper enzyme maturation permease subunit
MTFAPGAWLQENYRVYVGNATATRDFRVQLRGSRAVWLWALYLGVLIVYGIMTYNSSATEMQVSISEAQTRLNMFYKQIMGLLGVMILLVAPALTATAVVAERQRQSLDLVFSAPVSPKYYLVGKMLSSYRYTWMMLVLSLPVTSACVVLGGSTWGDVLGGYVLLSFHALVLTAIALLMSTVSQKPVAAIVWSYFAAIFYSVVGTTVSAMNIVSGMFGMGRQTFEQPFTITFSPFTVSESAPTYTTLFDTRVPNWVFMAIIALLISKIMLLAAGSSLSVFGSAEVKSLRIHGLIYTWALMFAIPMALPATGMTASSRSIDSHALSLVYGWCLVPLVIFLPFITCYGRDQERRFWPDGTFRLRNLFIGTPSGGLPYIWALVLGSALAVAWGFRVRFGLWTDGEFFSIVFYSVALWTFGWSIGRWASSGNSGVRVARTMHFAAIVALGALPVPFFTLIDPNFMGKAEATIWDLYMMRPLIGGDDNSLRAVAMGVALFMLAGLVTLIAERSAEARGLRLRTNE